MRMSDDVKNAPSRGFCRCCGKVEIFSFGKNKMFCDACLRQKRLDRNRRKIKDLASPLRIKDKDTDLVWLAKMNDTLAKAKKQGIKNYGEIQVKERGSHE